ncbi:MAG: ORC1-type DNA replication protein [archaeon]
MGESSEIIRDVLRSPTIFKDEEPLSIDYIPVRLPHRDDKLTFLAHLFRFILEQPGSMNQRVLITGNIGTGKTVVSQRFGIELMRIAKNRRLNLHYIHVNCRESRGSLFLVLKRVVTEFMPNFPQRGYSSEELLQMLMQVLDENNAFVILALDELESLIRTEGTSALYKLTRLQEGRLNKSMRLSLICIMRDVEYLKQLDRSTLGTLQQNVIEMEDYEKDQLASILASRVDLAFKEGTVPYESILYTAELASKRGDARYAIELLWRAGKYTDSESAKQLTPEHVRKAAGAVYPTMRSDFLRTLARQERLILLAVARALESSGSAHVTMGEIEGSYQVICEETKEAPRAHTQVWKYIRELAASGVIEASKSGKGLRGRTTLVGMSFAPASTVRKWLELSIGDSSRDARKNIN